MSHLLNAPTLSIIVPIFNEQDNIVALHQEIVAALSGKFTFEIIFVDDGSSDLSMQRAGNLKPLQYIRLRKNYGQTSAMDAGIKAAHNELIVTMDGDRQNDPADIECLVQFLLDNELDVVSGWRVNRKDSFMKKFVSRGANLIRGLIVKDSIHDSGCSLKVYRRTCFDHLNLYGEMHRFIPALLKIRGFNIGELAVNHRPRTAGVTKYNWKRTIKGFLDMISVWFWNKYAVRPLHLLGSLGIASLGLGFVFILWSLFLLIQRHDLSSTLQPFMALFFISLGLLFIVLGLIADMLTKIYYGMKINHAYYIQSTFENE
ncbi:MAG: glycosyltransferase family 2 protein [Eubacteriales bacterium]|nr:glycosyltransferase family 2 protein [Eubacteriales bacterium]